MLTATITARFIRDDILWLSADVKQDTELLGSVEVEAGPATRVKRDLQREAAKLVEVPVGTVIQL